MKNPTFATQWNAELIDQYYQNWLEDANSVDAQWQAFFEGFVDQRLEIVGVKDGVVQMEEPILVLLGERTQERVLEEVRPVRSVARADRSARSRRSPAQCAFLQAGSAGSGSAGSPSWSSPT